MAPTGVARIASELAEAVARALLPFRAAVSASALGEAPGEGQSLGWAQPLSIAPGGPLWLGIRTETWPLLQRQAGREEPFAGFASRVVGEFAQAVAARLEVSCVALDGAEAGVVRPADLFRLDIDAGGGVQYEIFAAIPPALAVALENDEARRIAASVDLLLDVELPVSVSFGRTLLPVCEVLRMTTGSMIELNRNVNDYVDVIVNNCVIARGEVVVIEGNYGIRVHEIVSRRERAMLQHIGRGAPLQPLVKASV